MSAFVVSHAHINALVSYCNGGRFTARVTLADGSTLNFDQVTDLQHAATILLAENYRSIHYRYEDTIAEPENTPGTTAEIGQPIRFAFSSYYPRDAVAIIKMCDCYNYQACETDDYDQSDAKRIITVIRERAIDNLPGYDKAPWDWNMPVDPRRQPTARQLALGAK